MIDTDKYEGHTPGPWWLDVRGDGYIDAQNWIGSEDTGDGWDQSVAKVSQEDGEQNLVHSNVDTWKANAQLIADAPLLLEEVKRLRSLDDLLRSMEKDGITASGYDHLLAEVKRLREDNEKLHDAINRSFHAKISGSALEIYNGWWEGEEE